MTLRLFFHSDDLKANVEVLDCTPHESEFAVVLRATLFHPKAAGNPAILAGSAKARYCGWSRIQTGSSILSTAR
jgi:hypothetical protein